MEQHIHGGDVYTNPGCLDFSANCNPLGTPEAVKQAVRESVEELVNYPQVGYGPLKNAIAAYENVESSWVICGNGAAELIYSVCRARKPGRALLPEPTFAEYGQALESVGCEICTVPLREDFRLDDSFLELLQPGIDVVFLCNPNNPTGLLIDQELLVRIVKSCEEKEILLVVDECFLDFVEDGETYSLKPWLGQIQGLFLLKAFTKRYAMAGIRLGYGLCSDGKLLEKMERSTQPWNVSGIAQRAGIAALGETSYVREGQRIVYEQRERLKSALSRFPLQVADSRANYIFFRGPKELWEQCRERGILIRDCSNYIGLSKGWYRIAVRTEAENNRLLDVMREIFEEGKEG